MINLDDIHSNHARRCALCGRPITKDNDSGWEIFVTGRTTQPVCAWCDVEIYATLSKSDSSDDDRNNKTPEVKS